MKISISTTVNQPLDQVWAKFDASLFKALAPPFPPVKLLRFDGSLTGNEVHLELNFLLFSQRWISLITAHQINTTEIFFIDEGKQLPFFLSSWQHKHLLRTKGSQTEITDEITFNSPLGWLLYPALWLQFAYRRPIYQKLFA